MESVLVFAQKCVSSQLSLVSSFQKLCLVYNSERISHPTEVSFGESRSESPPPPSGDIVQPDLDSEADERATRELSAQPSKKTATVAAQRAIRATRHSLDDERQGLADHVRAQLANLLEGRSHRDLADSARPPKSTILGVITEWTREDTRFVFSNDAQCASALWNSPKSEKGC